jgi:tetratricopeptide (TPR) repeat protein
MTAMTSLRFAPLAILVLAGAVAAQDPERPPTTTPYSQAAAAYDVMDWPRCAEGFVKAAQAATTDYDAAKAYFQAAACTAMKGDKEAAFALLDKAASKGFRDLDRAVLNSEITVLAPDPRWQKFLDSVRARGAAHTANINAELTKLHDEERASRAHAPQGAVATGASQNDLARRKRVMEIVSQGGAREAEDYFHAAEVLQHSDKPEELKVAHESSLKALELNPDYPFARLLAATTQDRHLMSQGKPQLYGTQVKRVEGKWVLWEVDPTITDQERAKWDVPPLNESRGRVERMNKGTAKPPGPAPKADPHATAQKDR